MCTNVPQAADSSIIVVQTLHCKYIYITLNMNVTRAQVKILHFYKNSLVCVKTLTL